MPNHKVLLLTSSYPRYKGDSNGNFVFELANRIKTSYDVFVIAPVFPGCKSHEVVDGITIYRHRQFFLNKVQLAYGSDIMAKIKKNPLLSVVVPFFVVFQFLMICKVVKKHKIRIIHAHWLIPQGFIAIIYKKLICSNIKVICTSHGADVNSFNSKIGRRLNKFILKNIDELTVVSKSLSEKVKRLGYNNSISIYPMGIDTSHFSSSSLNDNDMLQLDGDIIIFVGSLIRRKGIDLLINSFPKILHYKPKTKLLIIGEGNLKEELLVLIEEYGINDSVIFLGNIPNFDLPKYYSRAHLMVLPSLSEGFGLVLVEAMSCGTLVLASRLAEVKDIIIENETGFFFELGNVDSLSAQILYILENRQHLNHIREKAKLYVNEQFDWGPTSNRYIKLYTKLV